jgi:hypothetical protein
MNFSQSLNFSGTKDNDSAIKLYNRNRDTGYYFENLCAYCANNDIDLNDIDNNDFCSAVDVMEAHGTNDLSIDHYFFWIDNE